MDAANRFDRQWAGIYISSFAIDLIRERRMADLDIAVKGTPFDLRAAEKLPREKPFEFESWAIMRMPGFVPNTVRVGDGRIDGRATLATKPADHQSRLALAQVKGGKFQGRGGGGGARIRWRGSSRRRSYRCWTRARGCGRWRCTRR